VLIPIAEVKVPVLVVRKSPATAEEIESPFQLTL
jgi:hypothetical protein